MTRRTVNLCLVLCAVAPFLFGLASSVAVTSADQTFIGESSEDLPYFLRQELTPRTPVVPSMTAHRARTDWQAAIDSTWGPSPLTPEERLDLFNTFWTTIDEEFACWQDLDDVDWDALKTQYESEVAGEISRGRFAAIMSHLAMALREAHTQVIDGVVYFTNPEPGIPLLHYARWGDNGHFGAGLTPLPDSSLLVYKAVEDHPLGLEPGDRVLGYDGVPWKDLYPMLIAEELPITGSWWGCAPSAYSHSWLMGAGMNWHLFETIDVVKYGTENVVNLPTAPLIGQDMYLFCTEQMDVSGVPMPDGPYTHPVGWGIVEDPGAGEGSSAQIGYIYVWSWTGTVEQDFYNAVDSLMHHHDTDGLIIDFRMNYGGNMHLSNLGLELLFNKTVLSVGLSCRCDPDDHNAMCPCFSPSLFAIFGDPETFYEKPIAVLTGPGAISSGDFVAHRMKFHPKARFFGKSTTMAMNNPEDLNFGYPNWYSRYAMADAYELTEPDHYLTHDEFEVDEAVWLTPDDVAQGIDTVVEAVISWILDVPSVTVLAPNGGEYIAGLSEYTITWSSSDNVGLTETYVLLSTNSGSTFPDTLASLTDETSYQWTVPDIDEPDCRIKVVCYDTESNEGSDRSDADFRIVQSTSVENPLLAPRIQLSQNSPNPFSLNTSVRFTLPQQDHVVLRIYDCSGRLVRTMVNDVRPAGEYSLVWDGRNQRGRRVTSGLYYYELFTGGVSKKKRMVLLR